jgi:hypothetical protein
MRCCKEPKLGTQYVGNDQFAVFCYVCNADHGVVSDWVRELLDPPLIFVPVDGIPLAQLLQQPVPDYPEEGNL